MRDEDKTKKQLISELTELRQHIKKISLPLIHTIEATTDLVCMIDKEGNTLYLNLAGRKILGYGDDEDLSKVNVTEYCPEDSIPILMNVALPTAANDGIWEGELILRTKDGLKEFPVSQKIISHKNLQGEIEYFSTIIHDIIARKHIETALVESELRFRSLMDQAPFSIELYDIKGNWLRGIIS